MQRQQKLLLSFIVGGLMLFYGIAVAAALTPQEIAKIALGSTVHLYIINTEGGSIGRGSGFFVGSNRVATNYHVIEPILNEGALGGAKLVGKDEIYAIEDIVSSDKEKDLAIIKVRDVKGTGIDVPALPLGDSDAVQIGEQIYVAGNPQGLEGTFSNGIISAIRLRGKILQMTAPISPGSSGGPVLNESGEVIGISVGSRGDAQNLNFAIPVNDLKRLANIPITPPPVKPTPVKPKVESPPIKPKPVKPKVNPPPVEPKPVKPQGDPSPVKPKPVKPPKDPPKLEPPKPRARHDGLKKGIKLYEQAKYNEAIKVLSSTIRELEDSEQQALAYLYLGCSKRGSGEGYDKVREQFRESIRHNPNQKLPPRVGKDHPIFAEVLDEVRKELTGELTVISLLPQTEIWIYGTGTDRKLLGTGIVSSRLLRGNYIVEGIYGEKSQRKTIAIEPNRPEVLYLEIPPIVEHDSPSRISVGERIPLTLNLISSKGPQQVTINYKTYDRDGNELEQNNQDMRLWDQQSESSTWIYKVGLPSQKYVGSIGYYIEVVYENRLMFRQPATQNRHYQISIFDDKPPSIDLLNPPERAQFRVNQQTTVRAEVIDNSVVEEVRIYFLAPNDQIQKLFKEGSSDMYIKNITFTQAGSVEYYLTATDEAGNESQSESRHIDIRLEAVPQKPVEEPQEDKETLEDEEWVTPIEPGTPGKPGAGGPPPFPLVKPVSPNISRNLVYQGIWASVAANDASTSDWDGGNMFRLAYLREGKTHPTLGARLDLSHPDRTNLSAIVQWGPTLENSNIGLTFLGGIAEYENFFAKGPAARSAHVTPILGAGLKFYPHEKIVIDATSSIKLRSDYDTTDLYHYEIGARVYIIRELNLRIGYGKLYLGNRNFTTMQVGLGYTF